MKRFVTKSSANETLSKRSGANHKYNPIPVKSNPHIPGNSVVLQRKPDCPCDGGCPRCMGSNQPKLTAGQPLPRSTRDFFEPRFGREFSHVRVHTDSAAAETARAFNARAFTLDKHIVFDSNHYSPGTFTGRKLLAHELAHTLQQQGKAVTLQTKGNNRTNLTVDNLQVKKLNRNGVFSRQVLELIVSRWGQGIFYYTANPQQVVDALEASSRFVSMANQLDRYYSRARKTGIKLEMWSGISGSKFVPKGNAYASYEGELESTDEKNDTIVLDARYINPPPEVEIAEFTGNLIHEATHAYRLRVKKERIRGSALKKHIIEEFFAHAGEKAALEEIQKKYAHSSPKLAKQLGERIKELKLYRRQGRRLIPGLQGVTKMLSGGMNYLESFCIGSALRDLKKKRQRMYTELDDLSTNNKEYENFEMPLELESTETRHLLDHELHLIYILRKKSQRPPLRRKNIETLLEILNTETYSMKYLIDMSPAGMNTAEKFLFYEILLVKAYLIRNQVTAAWEPLQSSMVPKGIDSTAVLKNNARKLGINPRRYKDLRGCW
jgi:hypothetical protein